VSPKLSPRAPDQRLSFDHRPANESDRPKGLNQVQQRRLVLFEVDLEHTPLLLDAEGEMSDARAFDHPCPLQANRPGPETVEERDASSEKDMYEVQVNLVE
jgi:hypothetical protein